MHRPRLLVSLCAALAAGGCASKTDYLVVTVDARPAVHDARSVTVSLGNAGTTRMDNLALRAQAFPVTFSISAPGRTGELAIAVDALDDAGLVVGHGSATTTVAADTAAVLLDATDFVVNTDYAGDQFPSSDYEANGFQLAALPDGSWTAVFRDSCNGGNSCNVFARRFDRAGKVLPSQAAAGSNAFVLTAKPTTLASTPAVASNHSSTIAAWDFYDTGTATTSGVACRAIDASGALNADQVPISADAADVVSVAAMANDNFVIAWKPIVTGNDAIRMAVVAPDCSVKLAQQDVGVGATSSNLLRRSSVASSADQELFAWMVDTDLHIRLASGTGALASPDTPLVVHTATEQVSHARVAAGPAGGFLLAVRWVQTSGTGPGRIELLRVTPTGALDGAPVLVTDKSGSGFENDESFGLARRADGTVMVVWHACGPLGDDSQCGVFGRVLRDTGEPVGDSFAIPTTTAGDQLRPSVVGLTDAFAVVWSDASGKPPDMSGTSVRARLVYPAGL